MTPRFLDRRSPPHIATLILLSGISALNMSVFLPSLSDMAEHFEVSYGLMQLAVPLYLAATTVVQIVAGPLSDRYGRRPLLMVTLVIFILATVGCIFAPSITVFLVCRVIQAAVATAMVLSRAIVRDLFDADKAASMLGYVIMGMSIVPMIGPMLGGVLDELFGWQASFVLLILCGLLMLAVVQFDLSETSERSDTSLFGQLRATPELLRAQRFWAYVLTAGFTSGTYFALLGGASHVAGEMFGLSPKMTGLALGAPAIGYMAGNFISGRLAMRMGLDRLILWGTAITLVPMGLSLGLGLMGHQSPWTLFGLCTLLGLGNGLVMPNAMSGMLSVRPKLAGTASGIGGAFQIGGGAIVAAAAGFLLEDAATPLPLQAIMALCAVLALLSALWAAWRNRQLALQG
ncbi:MAG: Bcr/CflA family drug resistance efflux transporter [Rhodobacterales bacterium]|nr:MAG: Bcr/CflA family drug resistance efflux transporter [Rhodobacterales bacterium]